MNVLILYCANLGKFHKTNSLICTQINKNKRHLTLSHYCCAKDTIDVKTILAEDDDTTEEKEQKIEQIRNKSRLRTHHHNELFNKNPYKDPVYEYQYSVKYNRQMFGRYGLESGVNPGISWPTKTDLSNRQEYEKVAFPYTVQELVTSAKKDIEMQELAFQSAYNRVLENVAKLDKWKMDLKERIAKKEAEALAVKQKKEKLIEEVRRHFGFTIDTRDERFKEMLAVKEKEQKKKDKQAKMQEREKKALAKLMSKHETNVSDSNEVNNK